MPASWSRPCFRSGTPRRARGWSCAIRRPGKRSRRCSRCTIGRCSGLRDRPMDAMWRSASLPRPRWADLLPASRCSMRPRAPRSPSMRRSRGRSWASRRTARFCTREREPRSTRSARRQSAPDWPGHLPGGGHVPRGLARGRSRWLDRRRDLLVGSGDGRDRPDRELFADGGDLVRRRPLRRGHGRPGEPVPFLARGRRRAAVRAGRGCDDGAAARVARDAGPRWRAGDRSPPRTAR